MDLSATRINSQLRTFSSYRRDPNSVAVNAFFDKLGQRKVLCISFIFTFIQALQKIYQDKPKVILTAPDWPPQSFYPRLIEMSSHIISIPPSKINLYLPNQPSLLHLLHRKLSLPACFVEEAAIR